jgi:glycyl-tRNA synthetase beta chain
VEEHYRPVYSGAPLPATTTGAVLSIADKVDSICGCFSVGLVPTGASDPYALRRQGIGIAQILQRNGFSFSLKRLIRHSLGQYGIQTEDKLATLTDDVYNFIRSRISHLLAEEGYSRDVIAAVTEVSADDVPNVWKRVAALEALKKQKDFEPLAAAFKRVGNILKKSGELAKRERAGGVRRELFEHASESALYAAYGKVAEKVADAMKKAKYPSALKEIASLRKTVDDFFDGVMVLTDDAKVRDNRLNLLGQIATLFESFADFSKIST